MILKDGKCDILLYFLLLHLSFFSSLHLFPPFSVLTPPSVRAALRLFKLGLGARVAGLPGRTTFGSRAETKLSCLWEEWAFGNLTPLSILFFFLLHVALYCIPLLHPFFSNSSLELPFSVFRASLPVLDCPLPSLLSVSVTLSSPGMPV